MCAVVERLGFWLEVAPFEGDRYSVLQEAPRLLLGGMLEIAAVRVGFLQRGLLRQLADALNVAVEESWPGFGRSRSSGDAVSPTKVSRMKQTSFGKDGTTTVDGSTSSSCAQHGGIVQFQGLSAQGRQAEVDNPSASRVGVAPRGEGCRQSTVSGLLSPRIAVPWWLFIPGGGSLTSGNDCCVDWEPESEP